MFRFSRFNCVHSNIHLDVSVLIPLVHVSAGCCLTNFTRVSLGVVWQITNAKQSAITSEDHHFAWVIHITSIPNHKQALCSVKVLRLVREHMWFNAPGRTSFVSIVSIVLLSLVTASERADAFIGYNEDPTLDNARARCQNKQESCAAWQKEGQCVANPYYMRFNCAQSCQIPSCVGYRKQMSPWKGYATEYHTKQYATR